MLYKNGRIYEGQWENDVRNGNGYEVCKNAGTLANIYLGKFENGKAHGMGVYTWINGDVYDGQWSEGYKEGYGIWRGIKGDSYMGEWVKS